MEITIIRNDFDKMLAFSRQGKSLRDLMQYSLFEKVFIGLLTILKLNFIRGCGSGSALFWEAGSGFGSALE
jgi:hypothetical protein